MKIRMDFVTNSSSSSFLLARKNGGTISQKGRDKLADVMIKHFLGDMDIVSESEEYLQAYMDDNGIGSGDRDYGMIKDTLAEGYEILEGVVSWEECEQSYAELVDAMIGVLKQEENYKIINDDLSY